MTTVARLRECLALHFGDCAARTATLRLRECGLLPSGTHGRAGSAGITPRHAALALLALVCDVEPIAAPSEALRLSGFKLRAIDTLASRQHVDVADVTLIDVLTGQIVAAAGAIPDFDLCGWRFSRYQAAQRGLARMVFAPDNVPLDDAVVRETTVPAMLLRSLADLFAPLPAADFTPAELASAHAIIA